LCFSQAHQSLSRTHSNDAPIARKQRNTDLFAFLDFQTGGLRENAKKFSTKNYSIIGLIMPFQKKQACRIRISTGKREVEPEQTCFVLFDCK